MCSKKPCGSDGGPEELCDSCQLEMENAAIASALNMGAAQEAWHPDYGKIVENGHLTEDGIQLFMDQNRELMEDLRELEEKEKSTLLDK